MNGKLVIESEFDFELSVIIRPGRLEAYCWIKSARGQRNKNMVSRLAASVELEIFGHPGKAHTNNGSCGSCSLLLNQT